MVSLKPAEALAFYGLVLMMCGALAFQAAGAKKSGMSAIYAANGGALLSFALAGGIGSVMPKRGEAGHKKSMVFMQIAIVYPILIAGTLSWGLSKSWNVAEKEYITPYVSVMIVASLLTTVSLFLNKPKKDRKAALRAKTVAKAKAASAKAQ